MRLKDVFAVIVTIFLLIPLSAMSKEEEHSASLQTAVDVYHAEQYPKALDMFINLMKLSEQSHDDHTYIICTGFIGNIYDAFGDYNSSASYYEKGYAAAKRANDENLQSNFLSNLVTIYCRMGNVPKAKHYYQLLSRTPNKEKITDWQYFVFYDKARIFQAEHRYEDAVKEHRVTYQYAKDKDMKPIFRLFQLSEIGNLYVLMGKNKEAIAMGDTCMRMARYIGSGELLTNAYKMLADGYEHDARPDSARKYRALFFALNDSVYNTKKFYNARHKLDEYEGEMNMRHISSLNEKISKQTYIIAGIGIFLLILAILSIIIIRKNRQLVQAQRLLISKNEELEKQDKEKQSLLALYLKETKMPSVRLGDDEEKELLGKINNILADEKTISNPDFSLQMLADAVKSNTRYVSWVINDSYNKTFKTLLNEHRIRNACHKLADQENYGRYTMQAVYEAVGYTNAASFNRAFKKVYGMTPTEYQRIILSK